MQKYPYKEMATAGRGAHGNTEKRYNGARWNCRNRDAGLQPPLDTSGRLTGP